MKAIANGIGIHYRIEGREGAPWLIFSNSLMTNLTMWDDQVAGLADEFRILRYDQRGHGESDAPAGKYAFDFLVKDVIGLMDALSIERAHFVGLSMGGMTALFLAQRHGARFERIVACDCGPASTPQSAQQWKERIELGAAKGMEALVEPTVGRWFPPEFVAAKPLVLDKVRSMIRTTPYDGFAGCAYALSDYDLRPGLAGIKNPVLCICGTKDASYSGMQAIRAAVPGAALIDIEGAGHISNVEQPEKFTRSVRDFLMG
ncbi:MAG: 3-oxoadipate enol-lactonase [Hyphomicrobiales bacterium]|nr:3-oxoadipate enol-lactonase [Hyphomicrobiales bacterium]